MGNLFADFSVTQNCKTTIDLRDCVGRAISVGNRRELNWSASFVILLKHTDGGELWNFPFNCQTALPFAWTALASPPFPLLLAFAPPAPCGSHPRICSTSAAARSGNHDGTSLTAHGQRCSTNPICPILNLSSSWFVPSLLLKTMVRINLW